MRPIKTLKEYESRYKHYERKLLRLSKKEVLDFDKEANTVGEHYLLRHRKWVLLGDTYYEIPKPIRWTWFRGLNAGVQLGTCVLLAGAVGGASYGTYYLLTKNKTVEEFDGKVTEEQWVKSIDTIFTNNGNRNYEVKFENDDGDHGIIKTNGYDFVYTELDDQDEPTGYVEYETRANDGSLINYNNDYNDDYHIEYIYEIGDSYEVTNYYLGDLKNLQNICSKSTFNSNTKTYEYSDSEFSASVKFNSGHQIEECSYIPVEENGGSSSIKAKFSNYNKVEKFKLEEPDNYKECTFKNEVFLSTKYDVEENVSYQCFSVDFSKGTFDFGDKTKIELLGDDGKSHINNSYEYSFLLNGKNIKESVAYNITEKSYTINNDLLDKESKLTLLISGSDESYTEGDLFLKVSQVSK